MTSNLPLVKASKMIHIRSEHRTNGTNTNFRVDLNQPLTISDLNESMFLSLISAIIPNTWYNITATNQKFTITYVDRTTSAETSKQYTIPIGSYTTDTFKATLTDLLTNNKPAGDNVGSTYTTDIDAKTSYLYIDYTSTIYRFKEITFQDNLYKNFSLSNGNAISVVSPAGAVSRLLISGVFNLALINELRVVLTNLNTQEVYNNYNNGNELILTNILVNSGKNGFIYHYPSYRNSVQIMDQNVSSINIQLQDVEGDLVNLENVSWSCVIRCDYRKTQNNTVMKINRLSNTPTK
jgi:hypothetical protein